MARMSFCIFEKCLKNLKKRKKLSILNKVGYSMFLHKDEKDAIYETGGPYFSLRYAF